MKVVFGFSKIKDFASMILLRISHYLFYRILSERICVCMCVCSCIYVCNAYNVYENAFYFIVVFLSLLICVYVCV